MLLDNLMEPILVKQLFYVVYMIQPNFKVQVMLLLVWQLLWVLLNILLIIILNQNITLNLLDLQGRKLVVAVQNIMKRFIERLVVYYYWPWTEKSPKPRIKDRNKKAILITSSAAPAIIGRILMPCALKTMEGPAELTGAKVVKTVHIGSACLEERQKLNKKQLKLAGSLGNCLIP